MKNKDRLVTILLMFLLIVFPLHRIITYTVNALGVTDSFLFSINQVYYLWFTAPILIGIYIVKFMFDEYKIDKYDYIAYILLILGLITTIFAIDKQISVFGKEYRYEGLISIYTYIFIFLNAKNIKSDKSKHLLINTFLIMGVIQVVYASLQVYTNLSFIRHYSIHYMASGLSGNPNFFGSYMVMTILITSYLYLKTNKYRYLFLSILYFVGIVLASSTGPFLAVIISLLLMIYYIIKKEIKLKNFLLLSLSLIITFFISNKIIFTSNKTEEIKTNYNISKEIGATVKGDEKENFRIGNGRMVIWKGALPLVKEHLLIGAGFDNFAEVYPYNSKDLQFDKAHNIYLEMAICSGMPYLITYLVLCLLTFLNGFKDKSPFKTALLLAFIGYSIQGFANINVIDICFIFWMIMGLINNRLGEEP